MLEDGADLDGELFLAIAAAVQAKAHTLCDVGLYLRYAVYAAAVRANGSVRPDNRLKKRKRGLLVVEVFFRENRHIRNPMIL